MTYFLRIDDKEGRHINLDAIEDLSLHPWTYHFTSDAEAVTTLVVNVRFISGKEERFEGEYAERIALELGMEDEASQIKVAREKLLAAAASERR